MVLENGDAARRLYDRILQTANYFLTNCTHLSVQILAEENPTYAELAEIMNTLSKFIHAIYDDFDPMMAQQAKEYCALMSGMGLAIERQDQSMLDRYVAELNRKPFL